MKTEVLEEIDAARFIQKYACSTCWGNLVADSINGERYLKTVHCGNVNCTGAGFVTKHYVEKRRTQDHFDHFEAERNLRVALNLPDPMKGKTTEEILKEIGF